MTASRVPPGRRPFVQCICSCLALALALTGCSDGSDPSPPSTTSKAGGSTKELSLGKASACSLLTNDEVAKVVGSEVIGSSPSPGGDDACTFAYGKSTTVAPPDGPHLRVVVRKKHEVDGAAPIDGLGIDAAWNTEKADLALQLRRSSVTIDLPKGTARKDGDALAMAMVKRLRLPPPPPATSTSTPQGAPSTTAPSADAPAPTSTSIPG